MFHPDSLVYANRVKARPDRTALLEVLAYVVDQGGMVVQEKGASRKPSECVPPARGGIHDRGPGGQLNRVPAVMVLAPSPGPTLPPWGRAAGLLPKAGDNLQMRPSFSCAV